MKVKLTLTIKVADAFCGNTKEEQDYFLEQLPTTHFWIIDNEFGEELGKITEITDVQLIEE